MLRGMLAHRRTSEPMREAAMAAFAKGLRLVNAGAGLGARIFSKIASGRTFAGVTRVTAIAGGSLMHITNGNGEATAGLATRSCYEL